MLEPDSFVLTVPAGRLVRKALVFGLEDTLIPGKVDKNIDLLEVKKILNNLHELEKRDDTDFNLILVSGLPKEEMLEKLSKYKLEGFFKDKNVYGVAQSYLKQMDPVDKTRYDDSLSKDPDYKDEYYKQYVIKNLINEKQYKKKDVLYIGHDVWVEGYYTRRFNGIDFALIKQAFSRHNIRQSNLLKGLLYVRREWPAIKNLLLGKHQAPDYSLLDKYIEEHLRQHLLGSTALSKYIKLPKK